MHSSAIFLATLPKPGPCTKECLKFVCVFLAGAAGFARGTVACDKGVKEAAWGAVRPWGKGVLCGWKMNPLFSTMGRERSVTTAQIKARQNLIQKRDALVSALIERRAISTNAFLD